MTVLGFRSPYPLPNAVQLFDQLIVQYGHERTTEYLNDFIEELQTLLDDEPEFQELYGTSEPIPNDEITVIDDQTLTREEKVSRLRQIRSAKVRKPVSIDEPKG